jgi:cell wall assembly regulator SMI1
MAIDNDPGPSGKVGQVIYLVNECDFEVIADSSTELLDWRIDKQKN